MVSGLVPGLVPMRGAWLVPVLVPVLVPGWCLSGAVLLVSVQLLLVGWKKAIAYSTALELK